MPYPLNLGTAKEVEAIIRTNGAVPATVAILDGIPCVGVYIKLFLVYIFIYVHLLIKKKTTCLCAFIYVHLEN
jgi:hypothetical protein